MKPNCLAIPKLSPPCAISEFEVDDALEISEKTNV